MTGIEEMARASEERFGRMLALASDWYWEQDAQFRFTLINCSSPEADRINARRIGLRRWECGFVNLTEADWAAHRAVLEARLPFRDLALCWLDEAGDPMWTVTSGEPVFGASGAFLGYRGVARDITRQRRAEEALRASEQRFHSFMDHSPAIAWIKDSELRYRYVSEPFLRQLRKTRADVIGKTVLEVWPEIPESADMLELDGIVQREGRTLQAIDSGILRADGSVSHWLVSKFPLPDETGATHVAGVSLDITDRIEAEREIRELLDRLVSAQEWERKRLAVELHDLIGQNLTALGISLANLARRVSDPQVGLMQRTVEQTIEAIRGVMTALRPPGLDEYGLVPALRAYAAEFQARTTLRTTFESPGAVRRLPAATEMSLFRIAQEALTNAAKHSGALSVGVRVEEVGSALRLDVEDNGRGIADPETRRPGAGWGLRAMRERAQACGGTLRLESPGRGLRMVVEVPLGD